MYTVKEVCELTGLTRKQLYDYESIIKPTSRKAVGDPIRPLRKGYKEYDEVALQKLKQVAIMRSLDIPIKIISEYLNNPNCDKNKILTEQISLMELKIDEIKKKLLIAEQFKNSQN